MAPTKDSRSVMLPMAIVAPSRFNHSVLSVGRHSAVMSQSSRTSSSIRFRPRNPVAPVTNACRFIGSYSLSIRL
jgi:hypothetical protein